MDKHQLQEILKQDESPVLEFKREWYWGDSTSPIEKSHQWGEFLKDLISLSNGYLGYVGKTRHLVIGFSEGDQIIYDVGVDNLNIFSNIKLFKKKLIQKLESYTHPAFINIDIELIDLEGKNLLVFEIPSPTYITELKKELKTKTRVLDSGTVIVRKGQKSDEVRIASPIEYNNLDKEFQGYSKETKNNSAIKDGEEKNLTERSIEKTVQLYIDKNTGYTIFEGYPKKVRNWKESIVYEVYRLADDFGATREFIYIHGSSVQGKTLGDIKRNDYVCDLEKSIILIDKPNIKDIEKRKENIKQLFGTTYVYFIDEFGYEFLYKDCILPYQKYNLPIYVDSLFDQDDLTDLSAFERLKKWFYSENEPLFIVSGHGGIGKTTLAKQFLDYIYSENGNSGILFIDSKEIIDELSRNTGKNSKIEDVYDFYAAQMSVMEGESIRFSKELLKLSMDNGSLIIVLDGIDEVIAKLGERFDVETFITRVFEEYSTDINRAKVLITCRDHFWNEVGKKVLLPEITLKAFNASLASEFFSQYLSKDTRRISKAMEIAKSLAIEKESKISDGGKVFIPFLLDMIGYLIKTKKEDFSKHDSFNSNYLLEGNHTDFLIGKVCEREIVKLNSLSIDAQIEIFIKVATTNENGISLYDIKQEISSVLDREIENTLIEIIKGHPLLICHDNYINFRYDVFNMYFKVLYLVNFFRQLDSKYFDDTTARIMSGYLKYDSSFTYSLCERLSLNDDLVLFCIEIIEKIERSVASNKESVISSILAFLLNLLQKSSIKQSNVETRTELVDKLFGDGEFISGLCLVDVFGTSGIKPTFDFRGKSLSNCTFNNYEYFWDCPMNESTHFIDGCFFKNIDPRSGVKIKVWDNLFSDNCDTTDIEHLLNKNKEDDDHVKNNILGELIKIFRLFYERGNFYPRKQAHVRSRLFTAKLLPDLLDKGVIFDFKDREKPTMKQYKVSEKYKSVINYIEQGSQSAELFRLADELSE